ncbi:hypothetical protein PVT01_000067500 [Plasmodium vivax]|uniref:VIR protein n=1 Tax=Plasmodium vivax TaxID=5855 RepID=A0A1G4E4C6_PLAVI|nr:hypothetical protein PVT01_000067500 [Plasmodium vivax]
MSECKDFKKPYFNYRCYSRLKKYYDRHLDSDKAKSFIAGENTVLQKIKSNFKSIPDLLKLANYLVIYVPDWASKNALCSYINYWINQQIEKSYEYDTTRYKYFLDFADEFAKHYYGESFYRENTCSNLFSYLRSDNTYQIMKTLHSIYDHYIKIVEPYRLNQIDICNNLNYIDLYFKSLILDYRTDYGLHKILLNFREIVLKTADTHKNICGINMSNMMPLSIVPNPPSKNTDGREETAGLKDRLDNTKLNKPIETKAVDSPPPPQQESPREGDPSAEIKQQARVPPNSEGSSSGRQEAVQPRTYQGGLPENLHGIYQGGEQQETLLFPNGRNQGQLESPGGGVYRVRHGFERPLSFFPGQQEQMEGRHPEFKDQNMETSTTSGTTGSITDTISGFIRDVEPGPVLGVSGGMGVLFLLFKLDPSLEEEEDDSVKFLVLLEDFHQENSQIFKNMKVGLLDMLQ